METWHVGLQTKPPRPFGRGGFDRCRGQDQDALGSADGLSDGLSDGSSEDGLSAGVLSAGVLSAGVLDTGVLAAGVLEIGVVVAAGVLHATTAPPRLAASVRASRIRLVIGGPPLAGQGFVRSLWGPRKGPCVGTIGAR